MLTTQEDPYHKIYYEVNSVDDLVPFSVLDPSSLTVHQLEWKDRPKP